MKHDDIARNPRIQYRPIARPESLSIITLILKMILALVLATTVACVYLTVYCVNKKQDGEEEPVRWLLVSEFNLKISKGVIVK